ncbi:DDB1- and CUL4-associated factor 13 [Nucella lapillus]
MPKIKVLCRNPDDFLRETKHDIHKVPRSSKAEQSPFKEQVEYTRALNAVKLERTFAKPFLGALDGHRDGVNVLCKHPTSVALLMSGACDGEIICWNLPRKQLASKVQAHDGLVNGMAAHSAGQYFFSCGSDKTIKQWAVDAEGKIRPEPMNTLLTKSIYTCLDHHWKEDMFVTSGTKVDVWDESRSEPVRSFSWGVDSVSHVKFNPVETYLLGGASHDRSILLYDMRESAPLRKVIMKMRTNALSWNPMEAFTLTSANEDGNLYTFDMRNLSMPLNMHRDHTAAVMDVDYSPTGREFVSAGYDKVIRIFPVDKGRSREVYHTKRMQRVGCVAWSRDAKYILSASDEMNIRLWKAIAWEQLGKLAPREKAAMNYANALKDRFGSFEQVRRIQRNRHVPKHIYNEMKQQRESREAATRKEDKKRAHSKPGSVPHVSVRKRQMVGETDVPLGVTLPRIVTSSDGGPFGDDVSTEGDVSSEGERTDVGVTLQWTDCTRGLKAGGAVARSVTRRCCGMVCHQAVLWHGVSPGGAVIWCVTRRCCGTVCHQAVLWHGVSSRSPGS